MSRSIIVKRWHRLFSITTRTTSSFGTAISSFDTDAGTGTGTNSSGSGSGSGPLGVEGRLPGGSNEYHAEAVTITDPFLLYQNYVHSGVLQKDEFQLRVMKEFQKLYHRVLDYTPPEELQIKISLILKQIELKHLEARAREEGVSFLPRRLSNLSKVFQKDPTHEKNQLVKYITDEEELYNFASPRGLLVNGEVGCGKSMLMDIFAASLPHKSKMRWHYNNFILWVFTEMHKIQQERLFMYSVQGENQKITMENEFVLFEIAQKMIKKNTILMLDEFMLPDIASANIIKILFTYYFKLGGVLVATSNKLPEELYSNEFQKSKFDTFVRILNTRCDSVDVKSVKDYRSEFASVAGQDPHLVDKSKNESHEQEWIKLIKTHVLKLDPSNQVPLHQLGSPSSFSVYGRTTHIPLTFNNDTVCYLDYSYICQGLFSSSDYITLASRYKTVILDNVPIMTTKMKNEARRFITLLDAIYEAKCQFFLRSEVDIDYIFFPDASDVKDPIILEKLKNLEINDNSLDVQNEEMYAKTKIAMESPYRPNIASYDEQKMSHYNESATKKSSQSDTFKDMRAFTGDDEKFAYKRAVSRIKEMLFSETWRSTDRWVPIHPSMRPWEKSNESSELFPTSQPELRPTETQQVPTISKEKLKNSLPRDLAIAYNIPFRIFNSLVAPKFDWNHFWAMGQWNSQNKRLKDNISKVWIRTSIFSKRQ
ncbi:AFG1-like ATPase-domain-containing protein [Scheffersomyces amazonensis]|uniref:AFG1-like ATPase-domain-containing protein n=1 Tax=Scheffersomyces amazonensis TaxID=1078765 RepID=UPI00315D4994